MLRAWVMVMAMVWLDVTEIDVDDVEPMTIYLSYEECILTLMTKHAFPNTTKSIEF